jgi:hypothetical protein
MNELLKGFKGAATPQGIGSILAVFLVFALLAYFGFTPVSVASDVKGRLQANRTAA